MEAINKLNQISGVTPANTITETYLQTHKQDSYELQPNTGGVPILTTAATAKIKLNQKYSYLLDQASEIYNKHITQQIKSGSIKLLCPELQDINSYLIRTSWKTLNDDRVYNMYIMDIITSMRIYNITDITILQYIATWYINTNNIHCINSSKHYQIQLIALLHKVGIYANMDNINYNLLRQILNYKE